MSHRERSYSKGRLLPGEHRVLGQPCERALWVSAVPLPAEPLQVIFLPPRLWSAGVLTPWIFLLLHKPDG